MSLKFFWLRFEALVLTGLISCGRNNGGDDLSVPNKTVSYDCTTLTWNPATSTSTPQTELLYAVYTAPDPANLSTVTEVQLNGMLLQDFTADLTSLPYSFSGNDVNVVVKDAVGTKAIYTQIFDESHCCFLGDTLVSLSNGELRRIDSIKPGDEVLGYNARHEMTVSKVASVEHHVVTRYLHVKTEEADVKVTAEHPFHTGERSRAEIAFKAIARFEVGSYLSFQKDQSIQPAKIISISEIHEKTTVFYINLTAESKTYFANGFAVLDA